LDAVAGHFGSAGLSVLARHKIALLNRAFLGEAPQAFQEELLPFPSAQPANSFAVSCHLLLSFASDFRKPMPG
jgi:hypothetical protein